MKAKDKRKKEIQLEDGEVIDGLPYIRPRKKPSQPLTLALKEKQIKIIKIDDSTKLLVTSRLINAFNTGDYDLFADILDELADEKCEIVFPLLNKFSQGLENIKALWKCLFDAFPDGSFRISDTSIDHNLNLLTIFVFTGTKIFPISLIDDIIPMNKYSSDIISDELMSNDYDVIFASNSLERIVNAFYNSKDVDQLFDDNDTNQSNNISNTRKKTFIFSATVDKTKPIYTSNELLRIDKPNEIETNGRLVIQLNELGKIIKLTICWSSKCIV